MLNNTNKTIIYNVMFVLGKVLIHVYTEPWYKFRSFELTTLEIAMFMES